MFLNPNFLLDSKWAKLLYHDYASKMPIIDYHCHLNPKEIYENKQFTDLAQLWLFDHGAGDHYKWRLMRSAGQDEKNITGEGTPYEKFLAFVHTIEKAMGNPIYEWSHLELRRYFDIDLLICSKNAEKIWELANAKLQQEDFRARGLMKKMNVELVCTTDDPADDLYYHQQLKKEEKENGFRVLPTLRPDALMDVSSNNYLDYLTRLEEQSGMHIENIDDLLDVLKARVAFFHEAGGRLADHGMNSFYYVPASKEQVGKILEKRMRNEALSEEEIQAYQSFITLELMKLYKEFGWTLQMHMNVIRNASTKNFALQGKDHGFDSIGVQSDLVENVHAALDDAQQQNALPKIILYSLNPADWMPLATLMQSFQGEEKQKIQLGAAWWTNDTYTGMVKQINMFAEQSLLSNFCGMLTDSRSFLSYPRHEYFRRILCNEIGKWVQAGRIPDDEDLLAGMVQDICYNNANTYFGF
jgi:glucuronate isomerase